MSGEDKIEMLLKQNEVILKTFTEIMLKISAIEISLVDNNILTQEQLHESLEKLSSKVIKAIQETTS